MSLMSLVDNLTAVYELANADDREEGLSWYPAAHDFCRGLAARYRISTLSAAGIVAALSPQTSWPTNMRNAETFLRTGTCPTLGRSLRKATSIRNGALLALTGRKEESFWLSIVGDRTAVCIDRHAVDAAYCKVLTVPERKSILEVKGGYDAVADAYRAAAEKAQIIPSAFQATIWIVWRDIKGDLS